MRNRIVDRTLAAVAVLATALSFAAAPGIAGAQTRKPEGPPVSTDLPKAKQTTLGLYVTAAQAYAMWQADPVKVKIIDVRTPEEFAFVGHPAMAWNVPIAFVTYQRKEGKFTYAPKMNAEFVALVREIAQPTDTLLVTCRSGGRSAMGVNALAKAGFTNVYNIVDGVEGRHGGRPRERLPRQADEERLEELGALGLRHRSREGHPRRRKLEADAVIERDRTTVGAKAETMATGSMKRTLTIRNLFRTAGGLVVSLPVLVAALVRPKISRALREKVVLAVTAVNGCRLCAWGHTRWALAEGVPLEEINQLLAGAHEGLRAADPAEAAAILFAQSYAEGLDRIDPEALASLRRHYSRAQVAEILAAVRAITFGNLLGNTLGAWQDRFHGSRGRREAQR